MCVCQSQEAQLLQRNRTMMFITVFLCTDCMKVGQCSAKKVSTVLMHLLNVLLVSLVNSE